MKTKQIQEKYKKKYKKNTQEKTTFKVKIYLYCNVILINEDKKYNH